MGLGLLLTTTILNHRVGLADSNTFLMESTLFQQPQGGFYSIAMSNKGPLDNSCPLTPTFSLLQRKYLPSRSHSRRLLCPLTVLSSLTILAAWTHTSSLPSSGYRWPRREAYRAVDHTTLTHKCIDDLSPSASLPQRTHTSLDIFEPPLVSSMSLILFEHRHPCPLFERV
ncbi:hypothetical protein FB45DRAFT_918303 [Roridomyces roridus]|uniref:Uncharacterized protein n=1 Tax=Roridomyces roridus TaxID=1738132 RepID=A0AAD7BRE1_9AGAR|nr:hypothetical protein FB45DRAFT_918303 [Roridomyces roridus]